MYWLRTVTEYVKILTWATKSQLLDTKQKVQDPLSKLWGMRSELCNELNYDIKSNLWLTNSKWWAMLSITISHIFDLVSHNFDSLFYNANFLMHFFLFLVGVGFHTSCINMTRLYLSQGEELQLVREALRSLRDSFSGHDPQHHTLDTLEQGVSSLMDRLHSLDTQRRQDRGVRTHSHTHRFTVATHLSPGEWWVNNKWHSTVYHE